MAEEQAGSKATVSILSNELRDVKHFGDLTFIEEDGGNFSKPSYQEAYGAPVECHSPLGLEVGTITTILINVSMMIGTGVFSTPASILTNVGSVGLSMIYWVLGALIGCCQLAVYLEFASYFPNRSGSEVVYLEQSFPRPRYLWATTFAVQAVVLSFSSSNCIVMAKYLLQMRGHTATDWEQKGLAVGCMAFVLACSLCSTKWSLKVSNAVGAVKVVTLVFISITGLIVLGGHTKVADPTANFRNSFEGTKPVSGYGLANALVKVNFAYAGYTNSFNLVNEIKNPIKTLRKTAPASLLAVTILYLLVNIAYFAAVPKAELKTSSVLAASLFFTAVFGSSSASRALNFLIALSAFGNLLAVNIGQSRVIRECGRQGVLPWPQIWASTKPFGTPTAPYLLKFFLTVLMILAPPAGDAFNFVVDLSSYPGNVFLFAVSIGLLLVRRRRAKVGLKGEEEFTAWNAAIGLCLAVNVFLLVMPWFPPKGGIYGGDVSFWYATYCAVGLGILALCGIYYYLWIDLLPRWGHYKIRPEVLELDGGDAKTLRLVKVPTVDIEVWDQEHDAAGRKIVGSDTASSTGIEVVVEHRMRNEK